MFDDPEGIWRAAAVLAVALIPFGVVTFAAGVCDRIAYAWLANWFPWLAAPQEARAGVSPATDGSGGTAAAPAAPNDNATEGQHEQGT
jgi:hypothetical protein